MPEDTITEVNFRTMAKKDVLVLRNALMFAYYVSDELPVLFCIVENSDMPSPGEILYSREIIHRLLDEDIVSDYDLPYFKELISWVLDEFTTFRDFGDSADMTGTEQLTLYGIDFTPEYEEVLQRYINLLSWVNYR